MINSEDVKNKIVGEIGNKIVKEIDTGICKLIISIEKALINGTAISIP